MKVAIGDVSDASHVGSAALNTFSAVLIAEAAGDERERAFASSPAAVFAAWAEGVVDASVQRVIWVGDPSGLPAMEGLVKESKLVWVGDRSIEEVAAEVSALDEAKEI